MRVGPLIFTLAIIVRSVAAQDFALGPIDNRISAVSIVYVDNAPPTQSASHETLEWAAADSDLIVRGEVEAPLFDPDNPKPPGLLTYRFPWANNYLYQSPYAPLQIRVTETLKGPPQTRVAFDPPAGWRDPRERWSFTDPDDGRRLLKPGIEVLLFMRKQDQGYRVWTFYNRWSSLLEWVFDPSEFEEFPGPRTPRRPDDVVSGDGAAAVQYFLRPLSYPLARPIQMIELAGPIYPSISTNNFLVHHQPDVLLSHLRRVITQQDGRTYRTPILLPVPRPLRPIPADQPAVLPPYLLTIPEDWHWPLIMNDARASGVHSRLLLADYFHINNRPNANQLLTQLLSDHAYHLRNSGRKTQRFYPVRAKAMETLKFRSAPIPSRVILEPDDLYRPLRLPLWTFVAIAAALFVALATAPRWRRHLRLTTLLATLLLLTSATLWLLSRAHVLDLKWNTRWSIHQLTLSSAGIAYAREGLFNSDAAHLRYCRMPLHTDLDPAWSPWSIHTDHRFDRYGLIWGRSRTWAPGQHDRVARLPLWLPMLLSAALLTAPLARAIRRSRWKRQGRCPSCGYDLRHSAAQCPECGVARTKPAAESTTPAP